VHRNRIPSIESDVTGSPDIPRFRPVELTLVLPTFNEAANIGPILARIDAALPTVEWEVVFVDDDSPDGTAAVVIAAAQTHPNVRLVRRIGRRGLSTAVVEGALASMAPFIAVMDADMQHDEARLPAMLDILRAGATDLVVGTRYAEGGGVGDWSARRQLISRTATRMARLVTRAELSDPMSGFFMITRPAFESVMRGISGQGFKILLDILASAERPLRVAEVSYHFRPRSHGESKLDSLVIVEFLTLLIDKTIGRFVPARFVMFSAVGVLGLAVHMAVLTTLFRGIGTSFAVGQACATVVAMTFNFFVNNILTYRDKRLKGPASLALGLVSFYAVCSLGAVSNVGIADFMFSHHYSWWLAGVAGVLMGAVWNYAATSVFTWRTKST
jgi:dolichol-phosphate mannosyltransferase